MGAFAPNVGNAVLLGLGKGLLFIAVSSTVLYVGLVRVFGRLSATTTRLEESQKATEESLYALAASEERLQFALTASRQGLWDIDVRSREVIATTPEYAVMLGYDPATFKETWSDWASRLHPDDRERATEAAERYLADGHGLYESDFRLQTADGGWIWVHSAGAVVEWDAAGAPIRMVGVHVDITQRKLAEEELRRSEEQFRAVFESGSIAIVLSDAQNRFVTWNDAFEQMTGYSSDELEGMTYLDLAFESDIAAARENAAALPQRRGDSVKFERRYRHKDGTAMWARGTVRVVRTVEGDVDFNVTMLEDVTGRRAIEERLRLHKYATDHSASPVVWADLKGTIVYANSVAASLVGLMPQTLVGHNTWDFEPEMTSESWGELVRQVRDEGIVNKQTRLVDPETDCVSVIQEQICLLSSDDREYVTSTARDITDSILESETQSTRAAVSEALAQADTPSDAWEGVLAATCEGLGFELGEVWLRGLTGDLRLAAVRSPQGRDMATLNASNASYRYDAESALAVLMDPEASAFSIPIAEVASGARADALRALGLQVAVLVPVRHASQLLAVIALFSDQRAEIPAPTLNALEDTAGRVGQFMERARLEESLRHRTLYDELTGLPNQALFGDRLERSLNGMNSDDEEGLIVLMCEVDQFDLVNDTYGFEEGQRLLREAARRFGACLGPRDTAARFARDEFAILAHDMRGVEDAVGLLDRLDRAFEPPIVVAGVPMHVTVSTGCSFGTGGDAEGLLRDATTAMHRARAEVRGTRAFFDEDMHDTVEHALRVEVELRSAVRERQLEVHYQPILDLHSRTIVSAEALVRWRHPQRGLLPPSEFITIAEDTGLIDGIGTFVLEQACKDCAAWNRAVETNGEVGVSVNLSARQFLDAGLVDTVLDALCASDLLAGHLTLEITETALMADPDRTALVLGRLRGIGVRLAVDDFGTGYSSLSYLKRFALDSMKVDRAFIDGLPDDPDDAAISFAVAEMAHALGLLVVAEGVETPEQTRFLRRVGYDQVQGFMFGVPVPDAEFLQALHPALA